MRITKRHLYGALVGIGVLVGAAGIASAATGSGGNDAPAAATEQQGAGDDQQASFTSSITVDDGSEPASEAAEQAQLEALVRITPDEASAAALAAQPGTATKVTLENVDGNVVYTVEVGSDSETHDVTVDAGNGHVLHSEVDKADTDDGDGEGHEATNEADDASEHGVEDGD